MHTQSNTTNTIFTWVLIYISIFYPVISLASYVIYSAYVIPWSTSAGYTLRFTSGNYIGDYIISMWNIGNDVQKSWSICHTVFTIYLSLKKTLKFIVILVFVVVSSCSETQSGIAITFTQRFPASAVSAVWKYKIYNKKILMLFTGCCFSGEEKYWGRGGGKNNFPCLTFKILLGGGMGVGRGSCLVRLYWKHMKQICWVNQFKREGKLTGVGGGWKFARRKTKRKKSCKEESKDKIHLQFRKNIPSPPLLFPWFAPKYITPVVFNCHVHFF